MKQVLETLLCKSDAELARLAGEGNHDAFEALCIRHNPSLKKFLHVLFRNPALEKDAAQDLWEKVFLHFRRGTYSETGNFYLWLRTLAYRTVISLKRKKQPLPDEDVVEAAEDLPEVEEVDEVLAAERLLAVSKSIDKLNAHMRILLKMRFEENITLEEIAKRLNKKTNTVTSEFSKAIRKLRKMHRGKK